MGFILSALVFWFVCGLLSAYVASQKNRSGVAWFFIGLLCGPIGLIAIVGVPVARIDGPMADVSPPDFGKRGGLEDLQTQMTRK